MNVPITAADLDRYHDQGYLIVRRAFSPERVDPGNQRYNTRNIPKVIGGITAACTEAGALLYSQTVDRVVAVSSTRVAEMVKACFDSEDYKEGRRAFMEKRKPQFQGR